MLELKEQEMKFTYNLCVRSGSYFWRSITDERMKSIDEVKEVLKTANKNAEYIIIGEYADYIHGNSQSYKSCEYGGYDKDAKTYDEILEVVNNFTEDCENNGISYVGLRNDDYIRRLMNSENQTEKFDILFLDHGVGVTYSLLESIHSGHYKMYKQYVSQKAVVEDNQLYMIHTLVDDELTEEEMKQEKEEYRAIVKEWYDANSTKQEEERIVLEHTINIKI